MQGCEHTLWAFGNISQHSMSTNCWPSIRIHENSWKIPRIHENSGEPKRIQESPQESASIHENSREFTRINENSREPMRIHESPRLFPRIHENSQGRGDQGSKSAGSHHIHASQMENSERVGGQPETQSRHWSILPGCYGYQRWTVTFWPSLFLLLCWVCVWM